MSDALLAVYVYLLERAKAREKKAATRMNVAAGQDDPNVAPVNPSVEDRRYPHE